MKTVTRWAFPTCNAALTNESALNYLHFAVRVAALSHLAMLAVAWRAYTPSGRVFAMAPVFPPFAALPPALCWAVFSLCVVSLLRLLASPSSRASAAVVAGCAVFWLLQDVNRIQPYHYMYLYTILIGVMCRDIAQAGLDALRLMVAGVYFWAGFHKANATFFTGIFPWFIQPMHQFTTSGQATLLDAVFGLAVFVTPFFEAAIGIMLLFPRWQRLATAMAFTMLMVVLYCLGPFGHNWAMVVWPWNLYLFLMEYRLFFRSAEGDAGCLLYRLHRWKAASIVLFMAAPVLAMFSYWYSLPGFKLYSGNIATGELVLPPQETLARAPEHIRKLVTPDHRLSLMQWSMADMRSLVYPVPYAFRLSGAGLCPYLDNPGQAKLRITYPAPFYSTKHDIVDEPLCNP